MNKINKTNKNTIIYPKDIWKIILTYLLPKKIDLNFKTNTSIILKNCFWFYPNILSIYHYGNRNYRKYLYEEYLLANKPLSIFYKKNELEESSLENIYKIFNYNRYYNSKIIYPFLCFCDILFNIKKFYPYYYDKKLSLLLNYKSINMPFTRQSCRTLFYTDDNLPLKYIVEFNLFKSYNNDEFLLIINNEKNSSIYKEELKKVINNTFITHKYENINLINNFHNYYSKCIVNYDLY